MASLLTRPTGSGAFLELEIEVPPAQLEQVLGGIQPRVEVSHKAVEQTLLLRRDLVARHDQHGADRYRALEQHRFGVDEKVPHLHRSKQIGGEGVERFLAGPGQVLVQDLVTGQRYLAAGDRGEGGIVDAEEPPENGGGKSPRVPDLGAAKGLGVLEEVAIPDCIDRSDCGDKALALAGAKAREGLVPFLPVSVDKGVDAFLGHYSHLPKQAHRDYSRIKISARRIRLK